MPTSRKALLFDLRSEVQHLIDSYEYFLDSYDYLTDNETEELNEDINTSVGKVQQIFEKLFEEEQ